VVVSQTIKIQRQAKEDAAEAAERLRRQLAAAEQRSARELAAAEQRSARELAAAEQRSAAELALTRSLHSAEMQALRERARVERVHLLAQQQKQTMIDISRAVNVHAHMLATLWNQGASILCIEERGAREEALNPIFEQIGRVVNDFSVEFTNAHLLIEDDRLHHALNRINEAVLLAIHAAEDLHSAVIEGRAPHPNPIGPVQRLMYERAAEARHLAWDLLRVSLGDIRRQDIPDRLAGLEDNNTPVPEGL
jgi:hypothetical protein